MLDLQIYLWNCLQVIYKTNSFFGSSVVNHFLLFIQEDTDGLFVSFCDTVMEKQLALVLIGMDFVLLDIGGL